MSKYKDALKKLDELEAKRAELERVYRELRRSILHHGVENREFESRSEWLGPNDQPPRDQCLDCRRPFIRGQRVVEYLDDGEKVIARYHERCL